MWQAVKQIFVNSKKYVYKCLKFESIIIAVYYCFFSFFLIFPYWKKMLNKIKFLDSIHQNACDELSSKYLWIQKNMCINI